MAAQAGAGDRWGLIATLYCYGVTVAGATATIAAQRLSAGVEMRLAGVLLWQAASYALWLPVPMLLGRLFGASSAGRRWVLGVAAIGAPAVAAHAVGAALLEQHFSLRETGGIGALVVARAPIDILVFTAITALAAVLVLRGRSRALHAALEHAREQSRSQPLAEPLLVDHGQAYVPVDPAIIDWIGGAGNYAVVHWQGEEGLVREPLHSLEARLDPAIFARIHRSTLANLAKVQSAASFADGSWRLGMADGAELVVSRTYRDAILARLGKR